MLSTEKQRNQMASCKSDGATMVEKDGAPLVEKSSNNIVEAAGNAAELDGAQGTSEMGKISPECVNAGR